MDRMKRRVLTNMVRGGEKRKREAVDRSPLETAVHLD